MRCNVAAFLFVCFASAALAQTPPPPTSKRPPASSAAHLKSAAVAPTAPAAGATVPTLCVASAIGHKFDVKTIGLMVFGNALVPVDTTSWGLDDLVVRKISALAGAHFTVRRLFLDRVAVAAYEGPGKSIFEGGSFFRDQNKELLEALKASAAHAPSCSYYLAVHTATSAYANTNQSLSGLGILNHGVGILSSQFLFAIVGVHLYDAKTFELRAAKLMGVGSPFDLRRLLVDIGIRGLYRRVDESWLPNPPQAAAQNVKLRDAMWAIIEPGLASTIPDVLSHQ